MQALGARLSRLRPKSTLRRCAQISQPMHGGAAPRTRTQCWAANTGARLAQHLSEAASPQPAAYAAPRHATASQAIAQVLNPHTKWRAAAQPALLCRRSRWPRACGPQSACRPPVSLAVLDSLTTPVQHPHVQGPANGCCATICRHKGMHRLFMQQTPPAAPSRRRQWDQRHRAQPGHGQQAGRVHNHSARANCSTAQRNARARAMAPTAWCVNPGANGACTPCKPQT